MLGATRARLGLFSVIAALAGCGNGAQQSPAEVDASSAHSSPHAARASLHAFASAAKAPSDAGRANALGARGLLVRSADDAGRFELRARSSTTFFSPSGLTFAVSSGEKALALRATIAGASAVTPVAEEEQAARMVTQLGERPAFARVAWNELYPGIDMVAAPARSGGTEYQFVLSPGAKVASIAMRWEGATKVEQVAGGVDVVTEIGALKIRGLHAFAIDHGERKELPARHVVRGDTVGFEVDGWDGKTELVIDPLVVWSSFAGGTGIDTAQAIAVDAAGNVYVGGQTAASDFPHTIGTYSALNDIFITKLTPAGTVTWSAIYGGTGNEDVSDLAVDGAGNVYFVGTTNSTNFPAVGGFDTTANGSGDALVGKLTSAGAISWAGYLGSVVSDVGRGIALDASGNLFVTGSAGPGFPTTNGFQTIAGGGGDAFVTKISSAGALVWSSYLGGSSAENNYPHDGDIAVDGSGGIFVGGTTQSNNFPVTAGAYSMSIPNSNPHGFLTKITDGSTPTVAWSTYVNGSGTEHVFGLASSGGAVFLTGRTTSTNFPVTNGSTKKGTWDAFVTKFNGTGTLAWSTYYGGTGDDFGYGISVNAGPIFVTGRTNSTDLPTTGAFQATNGGSYDGLVARFTNAGALEWSSYLGGSGDDQGNAVAADNTNNVFVAGETQSAAFPLSVAFDATYSGQEGFVVRVRPAAIGAACTVAADCGGPCVDGFCCNTACTGACQACSAAKKGSGTNGTCGAIASGTDPDAECAAASCMALPAAATATPKQTCNGAGACTTTAAVSCGLYLCAPITSTCATNCVADVNCVNTAFCASPACVAKKAIGSVCSAANQCQSGFCADGVCCNSACTAGCQACTNAKTGAANGTCANVKIGTDPDSECAAATCAAGMATPKQNCNGSGACTTGAAVSCGTFPCAGGVCGTSCTTDASCAAGAYCAGTACAAKKANGGACTATNQCTSGFCVDGVCCDSACTGSCQACTAAKKGSGTNGTCGAITSGTDPDSECPAARCTAGSATPKETCDGISSCTTTTATACAPYACAGTACKTSCMTASDCAAPNVCTSGTCAPPVDPPDAGGDTGIVDTGIVDTAITSLDTGSPGDKPSVTGGYGACTTASECSSGFCVDGVCCDRACDGTCESCTMPFAPGKCVPVPIGLDPKMQCSAIPCTRTCNGSGTCITAFTGAQCAAARCTGPNTGAGPAICAAEGAACPTDQSIPFDCGAYACAKAIGACFQICASTDQCAPGNVCDTSSKSCVPGAPTSDDGGCSVHGPGSDGSGVLVALFGLVAVARTRRRRPVS